EGDLTALRGVGVARSEAAAVAGDAGLPQPSPRRGGWSVLVSGGAGTEGRRLETRILQLRWRDNEYRAGNRGAVVGQVGIGVAGADGGRVVEGGPRLEVGRRKNHQGKCVGAARSKGTGGSRGG